MSLDRTELDIIAADCRKALSYCRGLIRGQHGSETPARAHAHAEGYAEAMRDLAEDVAARAEALGARFNRAAFYRECSLTEHGFFMEDLGHD